MEWVFLLLSIPIGIAVARIDVFILWLINRNKFGRLRITGNWAEWIEQSQGRQFSLGRIEYNVFRRRYNFDGTNYDNDGSPYCHWDTVSSSLDFDKLEFHYVFATRLVSSRQITSHGYGVVHLERDGGELRPVDGYYMYAELGASAGAFAFGHTMVSIDSLPVSRNANAAEFLRTVFPEHKKEIG
ncbi:MAG: hypothetical protein ABL886_14700 [Rhodoglobus sp.]